MEKKVVVLRILYTDIVNSRNVREIPRKNEEIQMRTIQLHP